MPLLPSMRSEREAGASGMTQTRSAEHMVLATVTARSATPGPPLLGQKNRLGAPCSTVRSLLRSTNLALVTGTAQSGLAARSTLELRPGKLPTDNRAIASGLRLTGRCRCACTSRLGSTSRTQRDRADHGGRNGLRWAREPVQITHRSAMTGPARVYLLEAQRLAAHGPRRGAPTVKGDRDGAPRNVV